MKISARQYAIALYELSTQSNTDAAVVADGLLRTLKEHGNAHLLPVILKEYRSLLVKKNLLPEVTVHSATKIDDSTISHILKKLEISQDVTVTERINPEMIGGVFVKNNNKLFDLSLARRLARLGQKLKKA